MEDDDDLAVAFLSLSLTHSIGHSLPDRYIIEGKLRVMIRQRGVRIVGGVVFWFSASDARGGFQHINLFADVLLIGFGVDTMYYSTLCHWDGSRHNLIPYVTLQLEAS